MASYSTLNFFYMGESLILLIIYPNWSPSLEVWRLGVKLADKVFFSLDYLSNGDTYKCMRGCEPVTLEHFEKM